MFAFSTGFGAAVALFAAGVVCMWSVMAVAVLARVRARSARPPQGCEPISVLKPLAGADQALEANLRTLFEQSYPFYEIVFGTQDPGDPALALARKLKAGSIQTSVAGSSSTTCRA